jgi:hypothetical protein
MVSGKNGPAVFGTWCALIQVLSRHDAPRHGYCTDTGRIHGEPYNYADLEMLTGIPEKLFSEMFSVVESLGWVEVTEAKDTTRIPDGHKSDTLVPLHLDSDLDSDSNSCVYDDFEIAWTAYGKKGNRQNSLNQWNKLNKTDRDAIIEKIPAYVASRPDMQYRKGFESWINPKTRHWEDEIVKQQSQSKPVFQKPACQQDYLPDAKNFVHRE